jgi:DNA polymerase-3 subunit delta'
VPLSSIAGHRPLLKLLASAIARDTLPQSLLFSGPEGVGKFTTAVAVAQAVNCPQRTPEGDACGICSACVRIPRGDYGDVLIVRPAENGSILTDQIREAVEKSNYRPFEGRRRVTIIDDVHTTIGNGQDALLKRLEEPTSASMFILVTAQCDMLLPTVRSRCYQLRFAPLADAELVRVLTESHGMSEPDARSLAALSDGSIGQALARSGGDLADARDIAFQLLSTAASTDQPARRLAVAKAAAAAPSSRIKDRDALASRLEAAAAFVRDMQILGAGGDRAMLTNADMADDLAKLSRSFDRERGLAAFASIERALSALDRQANTKIVADWIALAL